MAALQISPAQAGALSGDVTRRHVGRLSRAADAHQAAAVPPAEPPAAPDLPRLQALHAALRADLDAKVGPTLAPLLAVDLDHCADRLGRALVAGARYREPAAAALMSAAAALGARWLADERLCIGRADEGEEGDGHEVDLPVVPESDEPQDLRHWAEASWGDRFRHAAKRGRALQPPLRYALRQAIERGYTAETLRNLADIVFRPDEAEALARFVGEERALLAAAGLDHRTLGDRRIESLCIAGDFCFGLGRLVRIAAGRLPGPGEPLRGVDTAAKPDADALYTFLGEALHALAEHPQ
jgi:hypothetical protein